MFLQDAEWARVTTATDTLLCRAVIVTCPPHLAGQCGVSRLCRVAKWNSHWCRRQISSSLITSVKRGKLCIHADKSMIFLNPPGCRVQQFLSGYEPRGWGSFWTDGRFGVGAEVMGLLTRPPVGNTSSQTSLQLSYSIMDAKLKFPTTIYEHILWKSNSWLIFLWQHRPHLNYSWPCDSLVVGRIYFLFSFSWSENTTLPRFPATIRTESCCLACGFDSYASARVTRRTRSPLVGWLVDIQAARLWRSRGRSWSSGLTLGWCLFVLSWQQMCHSKPHARAVDHGQDL